MKKIISMILTVVFAVSLFSGCEHNHKYGDWEIIEPATYSKTGIQVRQCRCGEKEEEKIAKLQVQTEKLKEAIALEELQAIYDTSMDQPSVWFEEKNAIYAYCKVNGKVFLYYNMVDAGTLWQQWYGYFDKDYMRFNQIGDDAAALDFMVCSKEEALSATRELKTYVFDCIPRVFEMVDTCDKFACTKIIGDDIRYSIVLTYGEVEEKISITAKDGCITAFSYGDTVKATYAYGKEVMLPDMNGSDKTPDNTTTPTDPIEDPSNTPTEPNNPTEPSQPSAPTNPTNPGGNFPFFDSTAPEINYRTNIFTVGKLDVALTSGSVGNLADVPNRKFGQTSDLQSNLTWGDKVQLNDISYGLFNGNIGPSALTQEGTISSESVLKIPIYGTDGRVQELAAITQNATYQNNKFIVNDQLGVRAVGVFEDSNYGDMYGYIIDLAFRSEENRALILATEGDEACNVTFRYSNDWFDDESEVLGLLSAYRFVFFDTESRTILATAKLDAEQSVFSEDSVTLEFDPGENLICDLTANATTRVSVLIYLDGNELTNADTFAAYAIDGIALDMGFTVQ